MSFIDDSITYREKILNLMLDVSGYIDDVAKHMIALAKLRGTSATVVCRYCGIELHASHECSVIEVRQRFDRECYTRRLLREFSEA